jgi:hypothetical protein
LGVHILQNNLATTGSGRAPEKGWFFCASRL